MPLINNKMKGNKQRYILIQFTLLAGVFFCITACSVHKEVPFLPTQKIAPKDLQYDFTLLQKILEEEHPSVYWYTSREVMQKTFATAKTKLKDSLTELQFRKIVSEVLSMIKCGHTSIRGSKGYEKWLNKANLPYFPFGARLYSDTILLTYNLYRKDTLIPRASILKSINGLTSKQIRDSLYGYLSTDANANNFKNIRLSNNFPLYSLLVLDSAKNYTVAYADSVGNTKEVVIPSFKRPPPDTTKKPPVAIVKVKPLPRKVRKQLKLNAIRRLEIDTTTKTAIITLTSFSGGKQKRFFKQTFKKISQQQLQNIVLDVRNNGGGIIGNSTALAKYIAQKKFKVADSVYAVKRISVYNKYIKYRFWYGLSMLPLTRKMKDGNYHFRYFEKKQYRPKRKYHFDGNVYAITGGYSFSATTLFLQIIKKQPNVILVGEETGGSAYGNSAVYIPDLTLPNSKLRVRMPIFRLVMNGNVPNTTTGIIPNYYVPPTIKSVLQSTDPKMEKVMELINGAQ